MDNRVHPGAHHDHADTPRHAGRRRGTHCRRFIDRCAGARRCARSGKQAPGFYRYKVGDFEVTAFNDGFVKVPKLELLVVNQPLEAIQKTVEEAFMPKDDVRVPFNPLLVNTGSKLVLFDTGFGDNGAATQGNCSRTWRRPASIQRRSIPSSSAISMATTSPASAPRPAA
jgi:hypothetical protein